MITVQGCHCAVLVVPAVWVGFLGIYLGECINPLKKLWTRIIQGILQERFKYILIAARWTMCGIQ
jgi:hypothetical protein